MGNPNSGRFRRNTDRRSHHCHTQLCLAVTIITTYKLINWRNRRNPTN